MANLLSFYEWILLSFSRLTAVIFDDRSWRRKGNFET